MEQTDNSFLEKAICTQDDYEQMNWHDCRMYGFIFQPNDEWRTTNLLFDIDYRLKWVYPAPSEIHYSFWMAPATLVFKEVSGLNIQMDYNNDSTELPEIIKLVLKKKVKEEEKWIYEWYMELQEGFIAFKSLGFEQIIRQHPVLIQSQILTLEGRNGISFSLTPYMYQ